MAKTQLSVDFLGQELINPFIFASAPPTKDYETIKKGFEAGWAGAVTKSVTLEPLQDKTPRICHMMEGDKVKASMNYEMGSVHDADTWAGWVTELKEEFPDRMLYISLFAGSDPEEWTQLTDKFQKTKADGLELNFSCPHSDHNGKGSVIGQDPDLCGHITNAVKMSAGSLKIMPKLPYLSHPNEGLVAKTCIDNGADAIAGINTIAGLCEIDIKTLKPRLSTEGKTTGGGISCDAIRPFGRLFVSQVANSIDYNRYPVSAMGGVSRDINSIVEYLALGANHLQVCTDVMNNGFEVIDVMIANLESYLADNNTTLDSVRGGALKYLTSWDYLGSIIKSAEIDPEKCTGCYLCGPFCIYGAITGSPGEIPTITDACDGCGSCYSACPNDAIYMVEK
ncbi:MAG: 4Fe-4S binding protein [archaeon]|nr:4Fe-4S binding protein [archaeon]